MRKATLAALAAALLFTTTAEAQGVFQRITGAGRALVSRSDATVGTVMRMAPAHDAAAREAVLILDTTIQNRLGCFIVDRSDISRVEMWGTFAAYAYTGEVVEIGELSCAVVRRFRAKDGGNPARSDFLATHSLPILAYALRHYPEAAAHFFPRGSELMPIAAELEVLEGMLMHIGALAPEELPAPVAEPVGVSLVRESELQACLDREAALERSCRGLLAPDAVNRCELELASLRGILVPLTDHHPTATAGVSAIDRYFLGGTR